MKIIAGKFKGRTISCLKGKDIRPTSGKIREAIFNILSSGKIFNPNGDSLLENAIIADLFCGTAAFALEALSRGAQRAIAVDIDPKHLKLVEYNASNFNLAPNTLKVVRADATSLPRAHTLCDLVFLDPPYKFGSIEACLLSLIKNCWLNNEAVVIIESQKHNSYVIPDVFQLIDERIYGNTKIILLRFKR